MTTMEQRFGVSRETIDLFMARSRDTASIRDGEVVADRFCVVRYLARGARSEVYEAIDRKHSEPGRELRVALKVFDPIGASGSQLRAFLREPGRARAVKHRGVVDVIDCGSDEVAGEWIAYRLMPGGSLWAPTDRSRVPSSHREIIASVAAMADAMHEIHRAGMIHLDIGLKNILIDDDGSLCISDLGIARPTGAQGPPQEGQGTPCFAAPEQLATGGCEPNAAQDLYALAGVALWLLTGEIANTVEGLPRDLSRELRSLPRDTAAVLGRSLSIDPAGRHASAAELACDLRDILAHKPLRWRRTPITRRASLALRRRPIAIPMTLVATALVLAGASAAAVKHIEAKETAAVLKSELQWQQASDMFLRMLEQSQSKWSASGNFVESMRLSVAFEQLLGPLGLRSDEGREMVHADRLKIARRTMAASPARSIDHLVASLYTARWLAEQSESDEATTLTARVRAEWSPRLVWNRPQLWPLCGLGQAPAAGSPPEARAP